MAKGVGSLLGAMIAGSSAPSALPKRFAVVDGDGRLKAFYCSDVHDKIPPGAVHITEAEYQAWLSPPHPYRLVKGKVVPDAKPKPKG